ncbi:MAG TPA: hypothetical protein PK304_04675 [Mobilitalea sp.]|nr:hypothetical protein [Mobilitalea sp.]
MKIRSLLKLELFKLINKKTTYLLIITLLGPAVFAVSMYAGASFIYGSGSESFDVISDSGMNAFEFAATMYSQETYITYLIAIVISGILLAGEIEHGQMLLFVKRICNRKKLLLAKYISLLFIYLIYFFIFICTSLILYFVFVTKSRYGNGKLFSEDIGKIFGMFLFYYIDLALASAVTLLLGVRLKTFAVFAISYILWIVSKYLDFFKSLELMVPESCAGYIMEKSMSVYDVLFRVSLFTLYILIILFHAMRALDKKDLI